MVILGVDPGFATVGVGVIEYSNPRFKYLTCGAILTPAGEPVERRITTVYDEINEIIKKYKPDAMAIEELFFNTNQKTIINVSQARGVILLAARKNAVPIFEYTPLQVKQAVVGYGRATKNQVMEMTKVIMGLSSVPKPDDAADALAIAICHAHSGGSKLGELKKIGIAKRTGG